MWKRAVSRLVRLVESFLRHVRPPPAPQPAPVPRPAPPVLVSVGAPAPPADPAAPADPNAQAASPLSWSTAWQLAWRGELLGAAAVPVPADVRVPADVPVPAAVPVPGPPLPMRPRRSKTWLFCVLLAELQAGVLLGAVSEVVRS